MSAAKYKLRTAVVVYRDLVGVLSHSHARIAGIGQGGNTAIQLSLREGSWKKHQRGTQSRQPIHSALQTMFHVENLMSNQTIGSYRIASSICSFLVSANTGLCNRPAIYKLDHCRKSSNKVFVEIIPYLILRCRPLTDTATSTLNQTPAPKLSVILAIYFTGRCLRGNNGV
jgi:hypothetical protein